jgi:bifunctional DNA-binding transcriptional regulator/antitoxin component of YhaV-PrlF toxin-antitoxin module
MVGAKRRVRIGNRGHIPVPADMLGKHHLRIGDEVDVVDTDQGVVITSPTGEKPMSAERETHVGKPDTEELARRRTVVARTLAHRQQVPSIAPLTAADLVHMAREDATWYGDNDR